MQVIVSHVNTDFDALASIVAANKLFPDAQMVLANEQNKQVRQFLSIYRDVFHFVSPNNVAWEDVTELILVDEASLTRASLQREKLPTENIHVTLYDHHPRKTTDVNPQQGVVKRVGSTATILVQELEKKNLQINELEATLFGLGIYSDTRSFTNSNTTAEDFAAAEYLKRQGMNLAIVQRFNSDVFQSKEPEMISELLQVATTHQYEGLEIIVCAKQYDEHYSGLSTLTQKLLQITNSDALITIAQMKNNVYIVGRAHTNRVNLLPLMTAWKGGGHEKAASANVKHGDFAQIVEKVTEQLAMIVKPAVTARQMMTSPVKTVAPETTIDEATELMYRYGHTGFPVIEHDQLVGIVTRRDMEKASYHGLGHAPVKAYMSTNVLQVGPDATAEEIQEKIIEHNIGRLPVVRDGRLLGIISRTNIIEILHKKADTGLLRQSNVAEALAEQLSQSSYEILKQVSAVATTEDVRAFLVGGMVRDLLLGKSNEDIDIVVEGDGIVFAKKLKQSYAGDVITHEKFGTATWTTTKGVEIDIASSRLEFYTRPAVLPDVERSTFNEDLQRRDFTINAIAIHLNDDSFGDIVDPFRGQKDLRDQTIRTLHNLSFVEDPTRILRGIRFETRFGFSMDEQTEQLAIESMPKIKELSARRLMNDLTTLFSEGNTEEKMKRLFELSFWEQYSIDNERESSSIKQLKHFNRLIETHEIAKQLVVFLQFIIPFSQARTLNEAEPFALTKSERKCLQEIIELQDEAVLREHGTIGEKHYTLKDFSEEALLFMSAQLSNKTRETIVRYVNKREQLKPLLTGADLKQLGLKPGSYYSRILLSVEERVLDDKITTKAEALAWVKENANEFINR
ncbi:MAG TPA: CBS domain-containing protein [Bacillota bacterium]|nr:CBS domain-containing protein [Bacillota bacterium]